MLATVWYRNDDKKFTFDETLTIESLPKTHRKVAVVKTEFDHDESNVYCQMNRGSGIENSVLDDFDLRSMAVGDVIEWIDGRFLQCDSWGWTSVLPAGDSPAGLGPIQAIKILRACRSSEIGLKNAKDVISEAWRRLYDDHPEYFIDGANSMLQYEHAYSLFLITGNILTEQKHQYFKDKTLAMLAGEAVKLVEFSFDIYGPYANVEFVTAYQADKFASANNIDRSFSEPYFVTIR